MTIAWLFILGVAGIVTFSLLCLTFTRRPGAGLLVVAVFALVAWEVPDVPAALVLAGVQVKFEDVVALALVVAAIARLRRVSGIVTVQAAAWVAFFVAIAASVVRGLPEYGPGAINESREFWYNGAVVLWCSSVDWSAAVERRTWRQFAVLAGIALSVLFVYHGAAYGFGRADSFVVDQFGAEQTGRPLVSGQALLLAACGLFLLFDDTHLARYRGARLLGATFVIASFLCQHRSVWVAIAVALALGLARSSGPVRLWLAAGAALAGAVVGIGAMLGLFNPTIAAIQYGLTSSGTLQGRLDSWTELIDASIAKGPAIVVFGANFGSGFLRIVQGVAYNFEPHNWYVTAYLRTGLVGGAALAGALLVPAIRLLVGRRTSPAALAVYAALCVYCWYYGLNWYLAPLLGWCIVISLPSRARTAALVRSDPTVSTRVPPISARDPRPASPRPSGALQ